MVKTRIWSLVSAALTAFVLSACGGGAEFGGTTGGTLGGTTGGTTGDPGPTVASLTLLASAPQLASDAAAVSSGVELTAITKDAANNVVPGIQVQFGTTDSAEIVVTNPAVTDETGRVTAVLTTGGDPENRSITVTATAGALSRTVTVLVVGSTLSISGVDNTQINVPTEYTALLTDASGDGIPNRTVVLETNPGNTLSATTLTTNSAGQVVVELTATQAETQLTATALGLTTTKEIAVSTDQFSFTEPSPSSEVNIDQDQPIRIQWLQNNAPVADGQVINFSATRGVLSDTTATTTNGVASVSFRSPESGFSTIVASSNALTKPSSRVTVEFVATDPARISVQVSPSTISATQSADITAVVRDENNNLVKNATVDFTLTDSTGGRLSSPTAVTNSQGVATITYLASTSVSATQSVVITGTLRGSQPTVSDSASLTVGGRAVRISIGTGSEIILKDESTYQLPFTVIVSDSAGNPVSDATFRLAVFPLYYLEGFFGDFRASCPNEDINNNDINDPGEDTNNNGVLDPGRVASVPATVPLDPEDGSGQFLLTYPKDRGFFVGVRIVGTATVAGTEATEKRDILLTIAEDDADNLPGISPYGTDGDCATAFENE